MKPFVVPEGKAREQATGMEAQMATEKWVTVKTQWCEIIGREAALLERRVYPADIMPDTGGYRVLARKCSADVECNLLGCHCKWAYTDPTVDRFALAS